MGLQIQEVDTRDAPESLLRKMHEYYIPVGREELPDDPPVPLARRLADWRHQRQDEAIPRWLLRDDDEIVGVGVAYMDLHQNLENAFARVHVRQDRRGRGLARLLAEPIFALLEDEGRKRLATYVLEGAPEDALLQRLGLKSAYNEKRSRLVISDVDEETMHSWVERAAERASDYRLLAVKPPFSDEVAEKYTDLQFQMNTAPLENLEMDDMVMTPAMWRDNEATLERAEKDLDTLVAIHEPTGEFVGSTSVQTDRLHPAQAWQWETVVHPAHRNKGLGRWLKGQMLLDVKATHPQVERIDTWNAGSNEPMLNINIAMGFHPILVMNTWQGDLIEARRRLLG